MNRLITIRSEWARLVLNRLVSLVVQEEQQEAAVSEGFKAISHWLPRFDVVIIGPGLGKDPWVHDTVVKVSACFCAKVLRCMTNGIPTGISWVRGRALYFQISSISIGPTLVVPG